MLAGTPVKNWRILLEHFYCLHTLADRTNTFGLGEDARILFHGVTYTVSILYEFL